MDNTSTSIRCDEVSTNDSKTLLFLQMLKVFEQRHVALPDRVLPWDLLEYLMLLDVSLLEDLLEARLSQDIYLLLILIQNLQVSESWVEGEGQVAREGPGCGGPRDETCVGVLYHWEGNNDCWIIHILIV